MLMTSVVNDDGKITLGQISPGHYTFEAPIPIELFSNGDYKFELLCVIERFGWILPSGNETGFKLNIYRNNELDEFVLHRFGGVRSPISPVLEWKINRVEK